MPGDHGVISDVIIGLLPQCISGTNSLKSQFYIKQKCMVDKRNTPSHGLDKTEFNIDR
jgi:hypothetical protein